MRDDWPLAIVGVDSSGPHGSVRGIKLIYHRARTADSTFILSRISPPPSSSIFCLHSLLEMARGALSLLQLALLGSALGASPLPTGILRNNTNTTFDNNNAKQQSDFEAEVNTAQKLHWSPGLFKSVRLYTMIQSGTTSDPISAFPAAVATNTTMLLGIWCSGTENIVNELSVLFSAIDKYGQRFADLVVGISVGSEDLYRVSESGIAIDAGVGHGPATMIKFINEVRSTIKGTSLANKPVGHVDSWSAWANKSNKAVIDAVDFVGTALYPYYEKDKGNTF